MELEDEHYNEVYQALLANPLGLAFDLLYKKCKLFDEETDLSRCLHRASQQGNVIKKNSIYKLTTEKYKEMTGKEPPSEEVVEPVVEKTTKVDPIAAEIRSYFERDPTVKPLLGTAPVEPVKQEPAPKVFRVPAKRTEAPAVIAEKPFGDLQRSKTLGGAALALYKLRNESDPWLSLNDLSEWTGSSTVVLSQRMSVLLDRKYVEKDNSLGLRKPRFKWADNFRYPFDVWKNTDDTLVKYTLLEWTNRTGTKKAISIPPDQVVVTPDMVKSTESSTSRNMDAGVANLDIGLHALPTLGITPGVERFIDSAHHPKLLDLQINVIKAQLELLTHIRENMAVAA